ncbi:SusC/RagA family TonB-linked outer membrane protein [Pedobacter antarcticus]|uniref:SusC/RagA family TonB-linked outer membrane protein n=1 Tax=Pedobacter antarcticus TaxID=34086 RepID=UPI00293056B4|nr:SusC/RagA family TonB-linked outer membrane protein [Pedobacter antarcticus]
MKTKTIFTILLTLFCAQLSAQEKRKVITGKVSVEKETSQSVPITIRAIKNKQIVITQSGELYSISVSVLPDTLLFTAIGYETIVFPITAATVEFNSKLRLSIVQLEQVYVNTGYQKAKINEQNGSVAQISNQVLNNQTGANILDRLDGVTSSLIFTKGKSNNNPQNKTNISIRGLSTINGPLDPLIVLDNFIYEGDIANINPNDVESISILKDAAAASIWGARAGNGVIVINTKTARFNQPLQISFNANTIITAKPDLFKMPAMSAADYIDVETMLFDKGYFNSQISNSPHWAFTPAVDILLKRRQNKISAEESEIQINALKLGDSRVAYSDHFYRSALLQQYNLGFKGGGTNNQYVLSVGYDLNETETYGKSNKLNLRATNTYKPVRNLTVQTGIFYTNSEIQSGRPAYNSIQMNGRYPNYLSFADSEGNAIPVATAYSTQYTDTAGNGKLLDWRYYPLTDYLHNQTKTKQQEVYLNTGINYQLFPFLSLDLKYQYQQQEQNTQSLADLESYYARNLINSYSQLNRTTGVVKYNVPLGGINRLSTNKINSQTLRGQINFDRSWDVHSLSAMVGAEAREAQTTSNGNILYGYYADPLTSGRVDFAGRYPNFVTGNMGTIDNGANLSGVNNRFVSLYSNLIYSLKRRYTLSASVRRDGSNIFGASTNDKWKPLWSLGMGWEISKESFFKVEALPFLKLTTTYGKSGNVDLSRSAVPIATYGTNAATNFRLARINTISNPSLRWEESGQFNVRADFTLVDQIVFGSIEYYRKKGTDLYGISAYDYTTWGYSETITRNVASMLGKGIDIVMQSKDFGQTVRWSIAALYSYNTSKTTNYYGNSANELASLLSTGTTISPIIGKPLYAIAAYKWAGLSASGDPMGYLDGQASTNYLALRQEATKKGIDGNIIYIGPANPVHFGSFTGKIKWNRLTADLNIGYKFGYYFSKPSFSSERLIQGVQQPDYANRWKAPGDEMITNVPAFVYPNVSNRDAFYARSEINVLKGDHIRLRYVNITYRVFPPGKAFIFNHMEVYTNLSNVGILWRANKENLDPDNLTNIPFPRTLAFGIRSNF